MLTEIEIDAIMAKYDAGQKLDEKDCNDIIYRCSWETIQGAVQKRYNIQYQSPNDFYLILEKLPLEDLKKYGIEYETLEMKQGEGGIEVKTRLQTDIISPLLRNSIEAIWKWDDVDIVSETHPHAKNGQNKAIKQLYDMFVDDVTFAKTNNDASLRAFVTDVDYATKANIEKLYKLGFELKHCSANKDVKLHYFNTFARKIDEDAIQTFRANLNDVLQQLEQKAAMDIGELAIESGIKTERLEKLRNEKDSRPKIGEIVRLQNALSKKYGQVVLLNKPPLGEYMVQVKRSYDTDEQNNIGIIRGVHQLYYNSFIARKTNFLPLVKHVKEGYLATWNGNGTTDAWLDEWGPKPAFNKA